MFGLLRTWRFRSLIPPGSATPANVGIAESLIVDNAGRIVLAPEVSHHSRLVFGPDPALLVVAIALL